MKTELPLPLMFQDMMGSPLVLRFHQCSQQAVHGVVIPCVFKCTGLVEQFPQLQHLGKGFLSLKGDRAKASFNPGAYWVWCHSIQDAGYRVHGGSFVVPFFPR
jgi:hypothetical protein